MGKTSEKVKKDPRRVEQSKRSYERRMKRLKEQILEEHQPPTPSISSSTSNPTSSTSSSTCDPTSSHATRSNDTYVNSVGILAILAIGVCVFFAHNSFQPKKLVNEKQDQPPKLRHMFYKNM